MSTAFSFFGNDRYRCFPAEKAAYYLAEAQHTEGVKMVFNHKRFTVDYVKPDGTLVPNYEYFYKLAKEGKL